MKPRLLLLPVLFALLWLGRPAQAQPLPLWQAAEEIRATLFQAQNELYAAARTADPQPHYDAAARHITTAAALYQEHLAPGLAPEAAAALAADLETAAAAATAGDAPQLAAARGRFWGHLLHGSYLAVQAALAHEDATAAADWLRLREYRDATRVSVVEDAAAQALADWQAGQLTTAAAQTAVADDLRDATFFRLRAALDELDAAAAKRFSSRAAEWAGLAEGYFALLQTDIAGQLGADVAAALPDQFAALTAAAIAGEWTAVTAQTAAIEEILTGYQPVQLSPEAIAKRAQLFYLFTELVTVEYQNGVRDGAITIPIEYQEAITFRAQAAALFSELRPIIADRDAAAADRLAELLAAMDTTITSLGPPAEIEDMVAEALPLIESSLDVQPNANDPAATFVVINTLLDELVAAVGRGDYAQAEQSRLEAYALFESGPESRLANRAPRLSRQLEGLFWEGSDGAPGLATLLAQEADEAEIGTAVAQIKTSLAEAESFLAAGLTGVLAALNSAAIIIREGLEAVLIIGAILGYMAAVPESRRYIKWVYAGVLAAIALSLLTWWASLHLITISVANRELIEGVTSLIAVAVLFYVTNWLFHKVYVVDWLQYVKEKVGHALSGGSAWLLVGLGFTVVYREGFETVLFYQALLFDADGTAVLSGFLVGAIIILAVAYAMLRLSKRLPLKPFFTVTGLLLMLLAFNFTGSGLRELQEAGVVSATWLAWMPENLLLMETLGIFPTLETSLAQLVFVAAIVITFSYSRWQGKSRQMVQSSGLNQSEVDTS
jgi:high-affinity iron transporter